MYCPIQSGKWYANYAKSLAFRVRKSNSNVLQFEINFRRFWGQNKSQVQKMSQKMLICLDNVMMKVAI